MIVKITETLTKEIEIDAVSETEGIEKAKALYWDGEVVLTADDFSGETEFEVIER